MQRFDTIIKAVTVSVQLVDVKADNGDVYHFVRLSPGSWEYLGSTEAGDTLSRPPSEQELEKLYIAYIR